MKMSSAFNKENMLLHLLFLYFILKPFYFFDSGTLQISDIILVIIFFILIFEKYKFNKVVIQFILPFLIFTFYVLFINFTWGFILGKIMKFIISSMFYLFNFMAIVTIIMLYIKYKGAVIVIIRKGVFSSLLLQFLLFLINGGFHQERMTLYFNNPNQLGYYSILSLALTIALKEINILKNRIYYYLGIIISIILCFISLSKAAIISILVILIIELLKVSTLTKKNILKRYFFLMFISVALISFSSDILSIPLIENVVVRLDNIGDDSDDSFSGRGYDRLINNYEYLIFGAGEGYYSRFDSELDKEIHSTLGNLLFSYGIIGSLVLSYAIIKIIKIDRYQNLHSLMGVMLYGFTHNGIRNTMLWIFLIILIIYRIEFESCKKNSFENYGYS